MSVTFAPRARMAVKASWPGVSRKGDLLALVIDPVSADVLGDAAGLARRDAGIADGIHERGLAVIDMAHEGDDGGAELELLLARLLRQPSGAGRRPPPCGRRRLSRAFPSQR